MFLLFLMLMLMFAALKHKIMIHVIYAHIHTTTAMFNVCNEHSRQSVIAFTCCVTMVRAYRTTSYIFEGHI